ncbi:hypothetical protein HYU06_03095 [Candidatus Woesearchaeota archaeon]|nr:hypothetical protein [Candidatus Woesearchaeota archaeon]
MKGKLNIYYDEEGDFLELHAGEYKDNSFKNIGDGVFEIIDNKTQGITGIAIHGFKKRTQGLKDIKLTLPLKIELTS